MRITLIDHSTHPTETKYSWDAYNNGLMLTVTDTSYAVDIYTALTYIAGGTIKEGVKDWGSCYDPVKVELQRRSI